MKIQYMPLSEIIRWPRNPKDHDTEAITQSIDRFGFVAPLLIDEKTKQLVAGHGRLDTLQKRKDDGEPPPERIKLIKNEWHVPVIRGIGFDNEEEAEAYLLADNKLTELGGWNYEELDEILIKMSEGGEDALKGVGFDEQYIKRAKKKRDTDGEESYIEDDLEYQIVISCKDENHQTELIKEFEERDLKCQPLIL